MTNPYAPNVLLDDSDRHQHVEGSAVSLFWPKHFATFEISFIAVWFALIIANLGFAKTFEELLAAPYDFLVMAAFGVGVWIPHAILAFAYPKMRRLRVSATAITGSTFFLVGMFSFDLLGRLLPRDMSMSLSWTPTYVLVPLYTGLSLTAVCVLVRFRSDTLRGG
jgi:hypothetical protein